MSRWGSELTSCLSKTPFQTRKKAKDAAQAKSKTLGRPLRPYLCDHCKMFHLTKKG